MYRPMAYFDNNMACADEKKGKDGQAHPTSTVLRTFVKHMRALHSARAALLSRGATSQVCTNPHLLAFWFGPV
jgi:hypothetical protein